ncbi:hypothetical protein D3C75_943120 [compost metagenome]
MQSAAVIAEQILVDCLPIQGSLQEGSDIDLGDLPLRCSIHNIRAVQKQSRRQRLVVQPPVGIELAVIGVSDVKGAFE